MDHERHGREADSRPHLRSIPGSRRADVIGTAIARSRTELDEAQRRAQRAASRRTWVLCDEIDRKQQSLINLHGELAEAIAICRALFDQRCEQDELDTLARAERIMGRLPG